MSFTPPRAHRGGTATVSRRSEPILPARFNTTAHRRRFPAPPIRPPSAQMVSALAPLSRGSPPVTRCRLSLPLAQQTDRKLAAVLRRNDLEPGHRCASASSASAYHRRPAVPQSLRMMFLTSVLRAHRGGSRTVSPPARSAGRSPRPINTTIASGSASRATVPGPPSAQWPSPRFAHADVADRRRHQEPSALLAGLSSADGNSLPSLRCAVSSTRYRSAAQDIFRRAQFVGDHPFRKASG